jgi:hypothetical protein
MVVLIIYFIHGNGTSPKSQEVSCHFWVNCFSAGPYWVGLVIYEGQRLFRLQLNSDRGDPL